MVPLIPDAHRLLGPLTLREEGRGQGEQCKAGERPGIALDQKSVPVAVKSGDIHLLLCQCIVGYSEREILKMF